MPITTRISWIKHRTPYILLTCATLLSLACFSLNTSAQQNMTVVVTPSNNSTESNVLSQRRENISGEFAAQTLVPHSSNTLCSKKSLLESHGQCIDVLSLGLLPPCVFAQASSISSRTTLESSIEALSKRIDAFAGSVQPSTSAGKESIIDPWQDTKSIILNIISNHIDSWLFGDDKENVGLVAKYVAILAFIIAWMRFILAVSMLNPNTPQTTWGRLKQWLRQAMVVRWINVFIGALAVLFTGAALYVVLSARAATSDLTDVIEELKLQMITQAAQSQTAIEKIDRKLAICQVQLSSAQLKNPAIAPATESIKACESAFQKTSARLDEIKIFSEAIEQQGKTILSTVKSTDDSLVQIKDILEKIEDKQPWALTKIFTLVAWLYLLAFVFEYIRTH